MNVLVVNPANKPFTNRSILAEPLDVLQIAKIINVKKYFFKLFTTITYYSSVCPSFPYLLDIGSLNKKL